MEYPCHSPTEQRWFQLTATPLSDHSPLGAVLMHLNISEQKRDREALRESERRFSDMLANVQLAAVMLDAEARITYCNDYLLRLTGWERGDVIGRDWFDTFMPPDLGDMRPVFAAVMRDQPEALYREQEIYTRTGQRRLLRWNNSVLRSGQGAVIGVASIGEDITEQKLAELAIRRLNRLYLMLSGINTLIVRVRDRDELFREACRLAVEQGGFKVAWIGMLDPQTREGKVLALQGGTPAEVAGIRLGLDPEPPHSAQPPNLAMRTRRPVICNDAVADAASPACRSELQRLGHRSLGCFPLLMEGQAVGVLVLYAAEPGVFDAQETHLLLELAGDISFALEHMEKLDRLEYLAYYDVLTGLANRSLFLERTQRHIEAAQRAGHRLALYLLDLARFKALNDSLGELAGDTLLRQVAQWLTQHLGDADCVARISADRFAVVLPQVRDAAEVQQLVEQTLAAFLHQSFDLGKGHYRVAAKIGVTLFPDDGERPDTLFGNMEAALKQAKTGGESYLFFSAPMTASIASKLALENQLRQALERDEFVLHYQPKVSLRSGKLVGAEALIRWNDPSRGLVPPGQFIPILEEIGLITEVGRWALRRALADYLRWQRAGLAAVRIAVNVSPLQLRGRGFVEEIGQILSADPLAAAGLELEITESLVMQDIQHSVASLGAIRALGVCIAIDDFGTGFSSLSYLARLPVDILKIDRSFVIDLRAGQEGSALVASIITLAHSLQLKVVAEGVETEAQAQLLRGLDCDEMQGYLFSKALPAAEFEARYLR